MYVTKQILEQYNACKKGIEWFDHRFPNGAEVVDVIRVRHIVPEMLHWGAEHLPTSEAERAVYREVLKIEDCENVFKSDDVHHSQFLSEAHQVYNSQYVYQSTDVKDSADIYKSNKIHNSTVVADSNSVYTSDRIVSSGNIKESFSVLKSNFVINSKNVINSALITDSNVIINSKNITDSLFLLDCADCNHCILCSGANKMEYAIFNYPVSKVQWEFMYQELLDFLDGKYLHLFDEWNKEDPDHGCVTHASQAVQFKDILSTPSLINWIKSLPYYDSKIAYRITIHPDFL